MLEYMCIMQSENNNMAETLNLQIPSPTFEGSTGGWLRAAEVEEKYAITWTSKKEQVFEMPTGGAAIMRQDENLSILSKKRAMSCSKRSAENVFQDHRF